MSALRVALILSLIAMASGCVTRGGRTGGGGNFLEDAGNDAGDDAGNVPTDISGMGFGTANGKITSNTATYEFSRVGNVYYAEETEGTTRHVVVEISQEEDGCMRSAIEAARLLRINIFRTDDMPLAGMYPVSLQGNGTAWATVEFIDRPAGGLVVKYVGDAGTVGLGPKTNLNGAMPLVDGYLSGIVFKEPTNTGGDSAGMFSGSFNTNANCPSAITPTL
ncbi:MAG: hypothetical protein KC416_11630 [Myxococcales bacterium]|nr:hypothetical protein [Myxococcales bacterium]